MPDRRQHRGAHPEDAALFASEHWPGLREAAEHLSWLLTRGYAIDASLKLVGDRLALTDRQRLALRRCACSDQALAARRRGQVSSATGEELWIDGFNLVITVEAALGGGLLLRGRDGCVRDLASMHGSYRRVEETERALALVAEVLDELRPAQVRWLLDQPVSNSGRLAGRLRERGWTVELVIDPDPLLAVCPGVVASSDSAILDRCARWFNLAAAVVARVPESWMLPIY